MSRIKKIFNWILGVCPNHKGLFNYPKKYRRNTAYVDDKNNWGYGCKDCQKEDNEVMAEMWSDYYSGRL